jgi:hypothetical protein
VREQEADGADVTVVIALPNQGNTVFVFVVGGNAGGEKVKDQVCAAIGQFA